MNSKGSCGRRMPGDLPAAISDDPPALDRRPDEGGGWRDDRRGGVGSGGLSMIRLFGVGMLLAAVAIAPSAVAQLPMSPVYRTEPERPHHAADNAGPLRRMRAGDAGDPAGGAKTADRNRSCPTEAGRDAPIPPLPSATVARTARFPTGPADPSAEVGKRARGHRDYDRAGPVRPGRQGWRPTRHRPLWRKARRHRARPRRRKLRGIVPRRRRRSSRRATARSQRKPLPKGPGDRLGHRQQARRRGPADYSAPPAYNARSPPYPGAARGYSGGTYGPSPYSSEGP